MPALASAGAGHGALIASVVALLRPKAQTSMDGAEFHVVPCDLPYLAASGRCASASRQTLHRTTAAAASPPQWCPTLC